MLGKIPQTEPRSETWTGPGSEKSFWKLLSGSQGSGPTLQAFRNGWSDGFALKKAPWRRAQ
jgi:hypothetical protein